MIRFVGLDVHKRVVQAVAIDKQGNVLFRERFGCSRGELETFAKHYLTKQDRVALEATTNTWGVVQVLEPFVSQIVVSNPLRTKAIASAKIKTDKVDALVLAQLLRSDFLPLVWKPPKEVQELRSLTSRRSSLVADRTGIKNRLQAVLHQRLITSPVKDLFGTKGLAWLRGVELDTAARLAIDGDLKLIDKIDEEVDTLDLELARRGYEDEKVKLLITQPGVNVAVAQTVLAALGDIKRFEDGDHAASYLGLVPSTRQSANRCYNGPITKQGSGHARWMLIQAAQHVAIHPGPLGVFFRRLAKKKNRNVAVVATARKLVVIAWHMLMKNEPYRYAVADTMQKKQRQLRLRATGKGTPKSQTAGPATALYRKGKRVLRPISEAYAMEELPVPGAAPAGETKMLKEQGLKRFADGLSRLQLKAREEGRGSAMKRAYEVGRNKRNAEA